MRDLAGYLIEVDAIEGLVRDAIKGRRLGAAKDVVAAYNRAMAAQVCVWFVGVCLCRQRTDPCVLVRCVPVLMGDLTALFR